MPKKVLVVDDTKNIRMLLTTCLKLEGYEVDTAVDGEEAVKKLGENNYDLAFVDIRMPQISGTELLKFIREKGIGTSVIIMTAYATVKNAIECTKLGALSYIQKPFSANKVRTLLEELAISNDKAVDKSEIDENIQRCYELLLDNNLDEALEGIKKIFSIEQDNFEVYKLLGKVYEIKGEEDKANKFFSFSSVLKASFPKG